MRSPIIQEILDATPARIEKEVSRYALSQINVRGYRLWRDRRYIDKNLLFSYYGKLSTPDRIFSKKHFKRKR